VGVGDGFGFGVGGPDAGDAAGNAEAFFEGVGVVGGEGIVESIVEGGGFFPVGVEGTSSGGVEGLGVCAHFLDLVLELEWARVQARSARARARAEDGGRCLIFMVYVVFICCG